MSKLKGSQKAWEALKDFWFSIKNIYTLCILPREKEALERKGFDPKCMVCIDRFENETVFVEIRISEPICIGLKDGGGKATSAKHSREDTAVTLTISRSFWKHRGTESVRTHRR